jgi:hypothetical protein
MTLLLLFFALQMCLIWKSTKLFILGLAKFKYSLKLFILIFNFLKLFKVFMIIKYSKFVVNMLVFIYKLKALRTKISLGTLRQSETFVNSQRKRSPPFYFLWKQNAIEIEWSSCE